MYQSPFGQHRPSKSQWQLIQKCRQLPASWWGKQRAQRLRKKILKDATLPLDLVLDGVAMRCHFNDNISERGFVFIPWRFDYLERQFLLEQLPKDGVFIDVGANVGIYSCTALSILGSNGRVLALEPNPPVADRLMFNLQATVDHHDKGTSFKVMRHGVSDREGTFSLYLDKENLGASSLKHISGSSIEIACKPLMALLSDEKITHIDVMKVDIEGAEDLALVPFLEQAPDSLLPKALIFEDNKPLWQLDVFQPLKKRGYQLVKKTRMNWVFSRN